jgi:hypothetical protein
MSGPGDRDRQTYAKVEATADYFTNPGNLSAAALRSVRKKQLALSHSMTSEAGSGTAARTTFESSKTPRAYRTRPSQPALAIRAEVTEI